MLNGVFVMNSDDCRPNMKTHRSATAPEGATHYNKPFYYRVVNGSCEIWHDDISAWHKSAWNSHGLLTDRDTKKVKAVEPQGQYMQMPDWRYGDDGEG